MGNKSIFDGAWIFITVHSMKYLNGKMLGKSIIGATCTLLSVASFNVNAELWRLDFNGQISSITEFLGEITTENRGDYNFHDDRFYVGQDFSGYIVLDDSALPGEMFADDPDKDLYSATTDSYLDIGGYVYEKGGAHPGSVQIWNRGEPEYYKDVFTAGGKTNAMPFYMGPGSDLSSFHARLYDKDGDVFSSTSLIQSLTELSMMGNIVQQFEHASLGFIHNSQGDDVTNQYLSMNGIFSEVTVSQIAAVPIPAAVWLLGSGLLGLIGIARRKKT